MSKAERMREMQHEINRLREENRKLNSQLFAYRKRDRPLASDFIGNFEIKNKRRN